MKCSLCGFVFKEDQAQAACGNCPLMKGCKLLKFPNCGFETPPEPKWEKHLKKEGEFVMTDLNVNQSGKICRINTSDRKKLNKIMAMGILPGMTVTLIQKFPSYVVQIGQSQFAIDKKLAECILLGRSL